MRVLGTAHVWIVVGLVALGAPLAAAEGTAERSRPVELSRDALALAARAQRVGDAVVLRALSTSDGTREERLEAIREAPYLHAPEAALPVLVPIASSRDPDLAPAASIAIHTIIDALDPPALEAREADPRALALVRDGLRRLADDASKRADVRRLSTFDAARLDELVRAP